MLQGRQASCDVLHLCRLRHVPLVSRRFSEACRDPSLWPELRVLHAAFSTEARWRSFLRWLAARDSGLQTLAFGDEQVRLTCLTAVKFLLDLSFTVCTS